MNDNQILFLFIILLIMFSIIIYNGVYYYLINKIKPRVFKRVKFDYNEKHLDLLYELIDFKTNMILTRHVSALVYGKTNKIAISKHVVNDVMDTISHSYMQVITHYISYKNLPRYIQEKSLIIIDEQVDSSSELSMDLIDKLSEEQKKTNNNKKTNKDK